MVYESSVPFFAAFGPRDAFQRLEIERTI